MDSLQHSAPDWLPPASGSAEYVFEDADETIGGILRCAIEADCAPPQDQDFMFHAGQVFYTTDGSIEEVRLSGRIILPPDNSFHGPFPGLPPSSPWNRPSIKFSTPTPPRIQIIRNGEQFEAKAAPSDEGRIHTSVILHYGYSSVLVTWDWRGADNGASFLAAQREKAKVTWFRLLAILNALKPESPLDPNTLSDTELLNAVLDRRPHWIPTSDPPPSQELAKEFRKHVTRYDAIQLAKAEGLLKADPAIIDNQLLLLAQLASQNCQAFARQQTETEAEREKRTKAEQALQQQDKDKEIEEKLSNEGEPYSMPSIANVVKGSTLEYRTAWERVNYHFNKMDRTGEIRIVDYITDDKQHPLVDGPSARKIAREALKRKPKRK